MKKYFMPFLILLISTTCFGATHYVSSDGTATWENSTNIESPCSLGNANANADDDDVVFLRGGTYNTHIFPANNGSAEHIITYKAYDRINEPVIISNTGTSYASYYHGIALISRSYIKVDGVNVIGVSEVPAGKLRLLMITHGSSYNEIVNCIIDGNGKGTIQMYDGLITGGTPCTNNWIHKNIIGDTGQVSAGCDDWGGTQLGVPSYDSHSNHNTFEDNVFYSGGHHNLETFTKYNVIRNNYFHAEGSMNPPEGECPYGPDDNGKYGNRNIQIYDGYNSDGVFNLIEGNRFGHSGPPPDDDGGDGFTVTSPKNIIRYNAIFNSLNNGVLFKTGYNSFADNNRFYNNTIYKSGRFRNQGPQWQGRNFRWYGNYARFGNVIKNNILNTYGGSADWMGGDANIYTNNLVENNFCTDVEDGRCVAVGDPLFKNPDVTDTSSLVLPDLTLRPESPAINIGVHLTNAKDSGNASSTLIVDDALYFQDGTWGSSLSNIQPDWIAVGTVDSVHQISSIDYATNTITLKTVATWTSGANIWLYKDSGSKVVLRGSAPDIGAYESSVGEAPIGTVTNLRIIYD